MLFIKWGIIWVTEQCMIYTYLKYKSYIFYISLSKWYAPLNYLLEFFRVEKGRILKSGAIMTDSKIFHHDYTLLDGESIDDPNFLKSPLLGVKSSTLHSFFQFIDFPDLR